MEEALNFVCPSKDCHQRAFSDEKQLISHKRKHDMVLCLNKPSQYSSDQTPTPTRFIRNCEAIGLFQDLQNVNPFDENFKKAAEAVKKGERLWVPSVSSLGKPAGEDLHTPHVDLTDDTQSSNNGNEDEESEHVIRTEADTSLRANSVPLQATRSEETKEDPKPTQDLRVFVRMPDGQLVQIPAITETFGISNFQSNSSPGTIIIPTQTVQNGATSSPKIQPFVSQSPKPIPINSAASAVVKQKLKAALLKTSKASTNEINFKATMPPSYHQPNTNVNPTEAKKDKKVTSSTSGDEDCERKRKTLERNRIAAMRCREKRKKWVADLRDKYEKMCATNDSLVKEVAFLRSEVARLKGLLIASCGRSQNEDLTTATIQFVPPPLTARKRLPRNLSGEEKEVIESSQAKVEANLGCVIRPARESLRLDIEGASRATVMDLDSPLVRSDEILSSVAPPTTPNERLISFPELDRVGDPEVSEEKMLTTVIQINPNALSKLPSAFS